MEIMTQGAREVLNGSIKVVYKDRFLLRYFEAVRILIDREMIFD